MALVVAHGHQTAGKRFRGSDAKDRPTESDFVRLNIHIYDAATRCRSFERCHPALTLKPKRPSKVAEEELSALTMASSWGSGDDGDKKITGELYTAYGIGACHGMWGFTIFSGVPIHSRSSIPHPETSFCSKQMQALF